MGSAAFYARDGGVCAVVYAGHAALHGAPWQHNMERRGIPREYRMEPTPGPHIAKRRGQRP